MREHIVHSFEDELRRVDRLIARMGELALSQFDRAGRVVASGDRELSALVVATDAEMDSLEKEVAQTAVRLLALRQPMAVDLRETLGAIRIAGDLERIGDLIRNTAKRAETAHLASRLRIPQALVAMALRVREQLEAAVGAYAKRDAEEARRVWAEDARIDDWYESLFRELVTYMIEDPRQIGAQAHLLFVAKNLERIGDHCAHMGDAVVYLVTGETPEGRRPKGADARVALVESPAGSA